MNSISRETQYLVGYERDLAEASEAGDIEKQVRAEAKIKSCRAIIKALLRWNAGDWCHMDTNGFMDEKMHCQIVAIYRGGNCKVAIGGTLKDTHLCNLS